MQHRLAIVLPLIIIVSLGILVTACSPAKTVTVTGPTTTVTTTSQPPPVTKTVTNTVETTVPPVTVTTTVTVMVTPTPTPTAAHNPYEGAVTGSWSGTESVGTPTVSGTFAVVIDATGKIQGTFAGSYTGTIVGQVDTNGNMTATGQAVLNGLSLQINWLGKWTLANNTLSVQGTWSDNYGSGIFSGSGPAAQ